MKFHIYNTSSAEDTYTPSHYPLLSTLLSLVVLLDEYASMAATSRDTLPKRYTCAPPGLP